MIAYKEIGSGEPLLLIHGLGNRIEMWESQYELSESFRLIIPELRGHGESSIIEGLTIGNFASDILELLDHLSIESVHLCGFSLGGIVAQEFYKMNKERVKSLILCNTFFYIPSIFAASHHRKSSKMLATMSSNEYGEKAAKSGIYNIENLSVFAKAHRAFKIRKESILHASKAAYGHNYLHILRKVNVPTLIIASRDDRIAPYNVSRIMNFFIPKSRFVSFDKTGHLVNVEKAIGFNQALLDFLI